MELALGCARAAGQAGEVPVGAVLVMPDQEPVAGSNRVVRDSDPTAHAEMAVIRRACRQIGNWRLPPGSVLYTTIEPCIMCMGAIVHARVEAVVFGAPDPRWGGAGSLFDFSDDPRLNHRVRLVPGVLEEDCRDLIVSFFRDRRKPRQDRG